MCEIIKTVEKVRNKVIGLNQTPGFVCDCNSAIILKVIISFFAVLLILIWLEVIFYIYLHFNTNN